MIFFLHLSFVVCHATAIKIEFGPLLKRPAGNLVTIQVNRNTRPSSKMFPQNVIQKGNACYFSFNTNFLGRLAKTSSLGVGDDFVV